MLAPNAEADQTRREFAEGRETARTAAAASGTLRAPPCADTSGVKNAIVHQLSAPTWITRVGNNRRSCTLLSSGSTFSRRWPAAPARMLAAATAS